jgi:D-inositol-3-phosphate glycosyltransferase
LALRGLVRPLRESLGHEATSPEAICVMTGQKIDLVSENADPLVDPREPAAGGQSAHVHGLAAALAASGCEVTVWTRRHRPDLPPSVTADDGVVVRYVDAGPAPNEPHAHLPAFAAALRGAWEDHPPQVTHAHHWTSGLMTLAAARGLGVPVVQTFHGLGADKRRPHDGSAGAAARIRVEHHLAYAADRIVATSTDEQDELLRIGASRERIEVVPAGVDVDAFAVVGPAHPRGKRARVVVLSELAPGSGVDTAVVAFTAVPDAELVVAGGAGAGDPDIARLRALAGACRVGDRVRFIGPVPQAEVPALLRSADAVACLPSCEPLGVVALQAMACGRPVVASAVGALADAVLDDVTGVLVPAHQPRQVAMALRQVLTSPSTAMAMGTAGRDRAEMRYAWARAARATLDVYAGVGAPTAEPLSG